MVLRTAHRDTNKKDSKMGHCKRTLEEGREGVEWELGFAFFRLRKWDLLYWDCDLITGNGMGSFKNGSGISLR